MGFAARRDYLGAAVRTLFVYLIAKPNNAAE
jgi:hypothetical protein